MKGKYESEKIIVYHHKIAKIKFHYKKRVLSYFDIN